ncbi:MAG: extracellular solute-binding protein [Eubacteriales bacterium]|nr:extracellular solute-binding protein [Eubacteriales bacterium]
MKKCIAMILVLALALGLAACGDKGPEPSEPVYFEDTEATAVPTETAAQDGIPFDRPAPVSTDDSDAGAYNHYEVIPGNLTVTAFADTESGFLRAAARRYEQSHPGSTVTIQEVGRDNGFKKSKYRDIVNTQLMSGTASDIVDVSPMFWAKLADSGRLLDLRGEIPFNSSDYYVNVVNSYLYKGGRFCVPLAFTMFAYGFNEDVAGQEAMGNLSVETLTALAERFPNADIFGNNIGSVHSPARVAFLLFSAASPDYVDLENKTANVNSEKFISMLESIRSIGSRINGQNGRPAVLHCNNIWTPTSSALALYDATGMVLLGDEGRSSFENQGFTPAVGADSPNKGLAIDFIQFLLSEEIQSMPEITSCPVNKNGVRRVAEFELADETAAGRGLPSLDLENNLAIFDAMASHLTHVDSGDAVVDDFVMSALEKYFAGGQSARETAENLQARLTMYLNE